MVLRGSKILSLFGNSGVLVWVCVPVCLLSIVWSSLLQTDYNHVSYMKGDLSPKNKCGSYDTATPEKCLGVSPAYVRSLEGSQKAG